MTVHPSPPPPVGGSTSPGVLDSSSSSVQCSFSAVPFCHGVACHHCYCPCSSTSCPLSPSFEDLFFDSHGLGGGFSTSPPTTSSSSFVDYDFQKKTKVWVVDGNIGAGKSTLLNFINYSKEFKDCVLVVEEPVEDWKDMLPAFYADPVRFGFALQIAVIVSHVRNMERIFQRADVIAGKYKLIIFERDALSCKIFCKTMNLHPLEKMVLETYAEFFSRPEKWLMIPSFEKRVYLDVNIDLCDFRIYTRSRPGEESIPLSYLSSLRDAHLEFYRECNFLNQDPTKVSFDIMDCNEDEMTVYRKFKKLIKKNIM